MTIERRLRWRQYAGDFDTDEKKVLLALSNKMWLWRTLDSLQRVTRLSHEDLAQRLDHLIGQGVVKGSVDRRTMEPIFGLSERVGGPSPMHPRPNSSPKDRCRAGQPRQACQLGSSTMGLVGI